MRQSRFTNFYTVQVLHDAPTMQPSELQMMRPDHSRTVVPGMLSLLLHQARAALTFAQALVMSAADALLHSVTLAVMNLSCRQPGISKTATS